MRPLLTARQVEIVRLLARGLDRNEIAEELVISPRTAKAHIDNIRLRLCIASARRIPGVYMELSGDDPFPRPPVAP